MTRKSTHISHNLFQRRNVRDLTMPVDGDRPHRSWKGGNIFHFAISVLLLVLGSVSILSGLVGQFAIPWLSSVLSLLGSIAVLAGIFLMVDTVRERKSIDNLVKKAIMRSIHDNN